MIDLCDHGDYTPMGLDADGGTIAVCNVCGQASNIGQTDEGAGLTAWGEPMPEGCVGNPTEHTGYSDFDGECRDCGYGSGVPTCDSCQ